MTAPSFSTRSPLTRASLTLGTQGPKVHIWRPHHGHTAVHTRGPLQGPPFLLLKTFTDHFHFQRQAQRYRLTQAPPSVNSAGTLTCVLSGAQPRSLGGTGLTSARPGEGGAPRLAGNYTSNHMWWTERAQSSGLSRKWHGPAPLCPQPDRGGTALGSVNPCRHMRDPDLTACGTLDTTPTRMAKAAHWNHRAG